MRFSGQMFIGTMVYITTIAFCLISSFIPILTFVFNEKNMDEYLSTLEDTYSVVMRETCHGQPGRSASKTAGSLWVR